MNNTIKAMIVVRDRSDYGDKTCNLRECWVSENGKKMKDALIEKRDKTEEYGEKKRQVGREERVLLTASAIPEKAICV
ncbi:hypothetical protein T4C_7703 [Trichinella pseudospiralis]|uniref:Uncharacterized protein n=1 Tax=Trichinella pseudospiralis TaxID=6337 RepID=A0A0V1K8R5_TRIPS|nr:hypothetical protein T4C_7703 [Trichinella pseudospiralis]